MRFGRRDKSRPLWGRKRAAVAPGQLEPVAPGERTALLDPSGRKARIETPLEPEPPVYTGGDATQKLLTVLGRFRRHVARAHAGVAQEEWSDDGMGELITAVEISIEQNWPEVVEALTGTGRVLQTYEDQNCAHLAVPFLNESHAILCDMVSDLITGNVRPVVMKKWRDRYAQAVADVEASGLRLIADDEEAEEESAPYDDYGTPAVPERIRAIERHGAPASEDSIEAQEPEPAGTRARTVASEEQDLIAWSESYVDRDRPTDLAARKEPDVAEALGITPEVAGILDALCDDLLQIEQSPEGNPASLVDAMRDKIMMLGEYAQDEGRDSSAALCHTMAALCEVARDAVHGHDDRFIEAAYGFCEAFVEASTDPNSAIVFNWSKEVQQLAEAWQRAVARPQSRAAAVPPARGAARPAPMPEPPEPVANIRPDGGALRALLQNAQRAIGDGNVSGAKVLVLEAAANLGKIEAAKAEQIVEQTERSLQRSTEAIAAARKRVKEAEDAVLDAEERVAQGEAACDEGHALVEEIADARKEMQAAIARFEAQILELRRQRETKEQEMHEAGAQFEEARRQYAEMEAELAHGVDTEKAARVTLEDARQHVKNLQRKHAEVEAALTRARDQLTQQLVSLDDIVNTIAQIQGGGPQPAGKSEDLLF